MQFGVYCIECLIKRQVKLMHEQKDEEKEFAYMKEIMQIMIDAPENVAAPYLISKFNKVFAKYFHSEDIYAQIKRDSNEYVMAKMDKLRAIVEGADDPLLMAIRYARVGNYIDFGALAGNVSNDELDALVDKAPEEVIDPVEYGNFLNDMEKAKKLLYITDNAGEIVFDTLLLEQLRKKYPALDICVAVRGGAVLNDALREDAEYAGLDKYARIIDNGTTISGTQISVVGEEMKTELDTADVIISKGQGNFETMWGCKLNVYYIFLCKCEWFTKIFRLPKLAGMFVNENRVKTYPIED